MQKKAVILNEGIWYHVVMYNEGLEQESRSFDCIIDAINYLTSNLEVEKGVCF